MTVGWLDCSSGVSGDMLLGTLVDLGALDIASLPELLGVDVTVTSRAVSRAHLRATSVDVAPAAEQPHRRLPDVLAVVEAARLPAGVADRAAAVFRRLASAEAAVHGRSIDEVEFHEVGAVDAIVDVVGTCLGFDALGLEQLLAGPLALGGGQASTAHGVLPVPAPAVLALLSGCDLVAHGGPVERELATPTGVALLAELATGVGPMPAMKVGRVGVGAGGAELDERPNVLRLVTGETLPAPGSAEHAVGSTWDVLAANVDDLDPRLWPGVLQRLLDVGAADAWLTPITMKKGRPAHTVNVLCDSATAAAVAHALFTETSTIGIRSTPVAKLALDREWIPTEVEGQPVRVKVARIEGAVVNASPEFDDVVRAAQQLGRPVKWVLAAATAAAHGLLQ